MANKYPDFRDDQHVFCQTCKLQITGPFQATGNPKGQGSMRGQCTGKNGCKSITYFDFWDEPTGQTYTVGDAVGLKR